MLYELLVENYAVVERLRVRFQEGLNLLTGETGSGKSIVVDTLGLLFGGRASADIIRSGAQRARISGIFEVAGLPAEIGMEAEDGELIVEREVHSNGKSRAFVNGRPVTAAVLRDLAPWLGDIHGQHDQQRLFEEAAQRAILDSFGEYDVSGAGKAYREWRSVEAELARLEQEEQERLRLADLWAFQKKEIESVAPQAGEDTVLDQEKRMLGNLTKLSLAAAEAYGALYDLPESALAGLKGALKRVEEICRIDPALEETLAALRAAEISLTEAAYAVRDYLDRLEADPSRLEQVEDRLAALDKLKRKYGATIEEILAYGEQVAASLGKAATAEDRARELRTQASKLAEEYREAAGDLTAKRKEAGKRLEKKVEQELRPLAMDRARLVVNVAPAEPSVHGSDAVTFLVSPNLGEEPRPIERVLSGGELSRLALALKCVSTSGPPGRTLVFDEVDAGIGGAAAEAVGRRLKQIASSSQVLCVTHLAQIAGFGDHHYLVEKREAKGRTMATVDLLDREGRVREIGRMLAGQRLTPEALRHAEQLLDVQ